MLLQKSDAGDFQTLVHLNYNNCKPQQYLHQQINGSFLRSVFNTFFYGASRKPILNKFSKFLISVNSELDFKT